MYLIIDCETSGLYNYSLPADHESQPHVASVAMLHVTRDFKCVDAHYSLIFPNGWRMEEGATKCNGLTDELLMNYGKDITKSLIYYRRKILMGLTVVSYNAQFDCKGMRSEFRRVGKSDLFDLTKNICMMRLYTDICKIPFKNNRPAKDGRMYKWPKLTEACKSADIPFVETHNALADCMPVLELMKRYEELSGKPLPKGEVHRHPNHEEKKQRHGSRRRS